MDGVSRGQCVPGRHKGRLTRDFCARTHPFDDGAKRNGQQSTDKLLHGDVLRPVAHLGHLA